MTTRLAPDPSPLLDALRTLYDYNERQALREAETKLVAGFLVALAGRQASINSMHRFESRSPPKDARFDAWGKIWEPKTDTFRWDRFPDCYMAPESQSIGAELVIKGLPEHAIKYKIEWWATIPVPPPFPQEDRVDLKGQETA